MSARAASSGQASLIAGRRRSLSTRSTRAVSMGLWPLALTRKNSLFAGSEGGAEHWAVLASLVETCKINALEPAT